MNAMENNLIHKNSFWQKLRLLIRNIFGKTQPQVKLDEIKDDESVQKIYFDLNSKFQYFLNHPKLDENFNLSKSFMFKLGYSNGINNKSLVKVIDLARVYSERLIDQVRSYLIGERNALEILNNQNLEYEARCKIQESSDHSNLQLMEFYKTQFPRTFSSILLRIYLFVAFFLFLADIPLAVELIKNGLDMGFTDSNLLKEISEIFGKDGNFDFRWQVIFQNWEVFLTAFGVAFFTIYIKIFFDEFLVLQYGDKEIINIKLKNVLFKTLNVENSNSEEVDDILNRIKKSRRKLNVIKILLFILTLGSIFTLALFRAEVYSSIQLKLPVDQNVVFCAFLCITLMFPIMSGICLSYGLGYLQNINKFRSVKELQVKSYQDLLAASTKLNTTVHELEAIESELELWSIEKNDELINKYTEVLLCFYYHGFNAGRYNSDTHTSGLTFYEKIQYWQNKSVAKLINEQILN